MEDFKEYMCLDCGWIYSEEKGLPEQGIQPGTKWKDVPEDFTCPDCDVKKSDEDMWQEV